MTDLKFVKKALMVAAGATAISLVGSVCEAQAFTLITDPNDSNLVTGIEDLDVNGSLFDVDFVADSSYDDLFTNTASTPTFSGDREGAEAAATAIISALGDTFATAVTTEFGVDVDTDNFEVPYSTLATIPPIGPFPSLVVGWGDFSNLLDVDDLETSNSNGSLLNIQQPIAVFTTAEPEPVPEPATILGSLAALSLGAVLKKKQQQKG